MKKKLLGLLLVLVMVMTACGPQTQTQEEGDTILIGGIGPLTGPVSTYGVTSMNAAKMAIAEINAQGGILGKQVKFLLEDDKGDNTEALNAYNKLVDQGVVAILGTITSGPSAAIAPATKEDNMPMVTPTGTQLNITQGNPNYFRVCFTDPFQGEILAQYVKEEGYQTVAVLRNNSQEYSDGVASAFVSKAKELGLDIVAEESYSEGDADYRVQLSNLKQINPDVLLIPDYYETNALILNQAHEVGLESKIIGGDGWDGILTQINTGEEDLVEDVVFSNHYSLDDPDENIQKFISNYREEYNGDPSAFSALSYDGVYLLKQAIEEAASTDRQAIIDALKASDFSGITGNLTFDDNNNPIKVVSMIQVKDGAYKLERLIEIK